MIRLLILVWLFHANLFACATCAVMTPMTEVHITLQGDKTTVKNIHYKWQFSEIYSSELLLQYDFNGNGELDEKERQEIESIKVEYLKPRHMLTSITYNNVGSIKEHKLTSTFKNFKLEYKDRHFTFSYDGITNYKPEAESVLSFVFEDKEDFFDFRVVALEKENLDLHARENTYLFTAAVLFENSLAVSESKKSEKFQEDLPVDIIEESEPTLLEKSITAIKELLDEIKQNQSIGAIAMLLLFSYLYGLIHALGPGHGKTLVSSYFLGNERSITKALFVSLAIGVVHTFSAFLLTAIVYFLLNQLLSQVMDDVVKVTTVISALIIIAIALWLIINKIRVYKKTPVYDFQVSAPQQFSSLHVKQNRALHVDSCACHSCKVDKNSTDAALIISAGIVPCPGTVTLFIFAFSLGLYSVGIAAALVMSLGMSTIIFVSAAASTLLRRQATSRLDKLKPYLEFGSLGIIFLLGVALLFF